MSDNKVVIYHPVIGESKVHKSAVKAWERNGWSTKKPVKKRGLPKVTESESKAEKTEAE